MRENVVAMGRKKQDFGLREETDLSMKFFSARLSQVGLFVMSKFGLDNQNSFGWEGLRLGLSQFSGARCCGFQQRAEFVVCAAGDSDSPGCSDSAGPRRGPHK
jgi:hypothetical protein